MCQFIESICWEHGKFYLVDLHQERVDSSFQRFNRSSVIDLREILRSVEIRTPQKHKIRVVYDLEGYYEVEALPYQPPKLSSFEIVEAPEIDYSLKYKDRSSLNQLKENSNASEVIITQKGHITDTTFSNLIFLKNGEWFTPKSYLLNGVQRQNLLQKRQVKEVEITLDNLSEYSYFKIINAMNCFEISPMFSIDLIK
ncbi:aminotransferase class IV [Riemerella anatipestifer]|nr:aminotransferase class IV [Riemerella anatipestifer]MDY3532753.1 aminotransferase class IV [Riemerella anatipestifer]MDY3534692.1 aminotransferase class IV [Riemerella anatipestifer]